MDRKQYIYLTAAALLVFAGLTFLGEQPYFKQLHTPYPFRETASVAPYAYVSGVSGFRAVTADFLWMDIVQYIGDPEIMKIRYPELGRKFSNLILMDPNFTYPYLAISGMFMFELKEREKALELIKEGMKNNPKYWIFNMYLAAYTYSMKWDATKDTRDFRKIVLNIENAMRDESHPPMLERILGSLYLKLAELEPANKQVWETRAIKHWLRMYENRRKN